MERLLADISQESTKIQELQCMCTTFLDHLATDDGKDDCYSSSNLQHILQIFQLCVKSDIGKLNALSIDLVRVYIRRISESGNDASKEETISIVLKCCRDMLTETSAATTLELLAIIVELVATFSAYLITKHVIEIVEMCHSLIKQHVLASTKSSSTSRASSLFNVATSTFAFTPRVSMEDKVLSAIYLTASQVCHHFTKHRILGAGGGPTTSTTSSVSSIVETSNSKVSQDFIYLLLYLSKKLECKIGLYRDMKKTSDDLNPEGISKDQQQQPKGEIFVLIKIYNCLYLKCLQYVLLTIPDAWKYMTSHLMEIVCRHLIPILVDIVTPLSTIRVNSGKAGSLKSDLNFGRGTEKVTLGSGSNTNKDFLYNTLNYQERQYIYKISLELLRLFGLENSMRPLLEALFHRILLLPPLEQRLDSLIFMHEILKNPLLVLILMSNPICLFGASSSHSQNLDLFKIFVDAIQESSQAEDTLLVQLSSLCLATLLGTLDSLTSRSGLQEEGNSSTINKEHASIWKSPTVKMILSFAANNEGLYEQGSSHTTRTGAHKSTSYGSQLSKYHSLVTRYNIHNLKNRICGYDSKSYQRHASMPHSETAQSSGPNEQHASDSPVTNFGYRKADFNYQDRLKALVCSQMSSLDSADGPHLGHSNQESESRTVELENQGKASKSSNSAPKSPKRINRLIERRHRSLHLSLEDLSRNFHLDVINLKCTNSDSRLIVKGQIPLVDRYAAERITSYDTDNSVFDDELTSDESSLSDSHSCHAEKDEEHLLEEDAEGRGRILMFSGHLENDGDANLRHFERALSHIFLRKLRLLLPELVTCRNLLLVDDSIQLFASSYCKDLFRNLKQLNQAHTKQINANSVAALGDLTQDEIDILTQYSHLVDCLFINSDGIYLATYKTLLLTMKLIYRGYYQEDGNKTVPLTESEFVDEIFNYHTTIFLSSQFLAEIYQSTLAENCFTFLMPSGELTEKLEAIPLIKLLHDTDILDVTNPNAYKLSDYARLEQMVRSSRVTVVSDKSRSLAIIIKRFLVHFWDTLLNCLRIALKVRFTYINVVTSLEQVNSSYINSLCSALHCPNKQTLGQMKSDAAYLHMMQLLLTTSIQVNAFSRLDSLYRLFFEHICKFAYQEKASPLLPDLKASLKMRKSSTTPNLVATAERLQLALSPDQISSIKMLLNRSSQVATHCPRIWRHVFDLCKFVTDLENTMFRSVHSSLLSRARISIGTILRSNSISTQLSTASSGTGESSVAGSDHYQSLYNFGSAFNALPGISEAENINVEANFDAMLDEIKSKNANHLQLKSKELEQVVEYLSWFVGQIFENVALKFNLSLLSHFIEQLCEYSSGQLECIKQNLEVNPPLVALSGGVLEISSSEFKSLMISRLVEVILRFVRAGRPLLHFMKIWPTASAHLVDASTHCELAISKKAITSMHDIINAVLSAYTEPDFFNFNESLFKPYERLLLFELCNSDCQQELLLNSICEFVEGASSEIRSGWRSIFKALRGLRLSIGDSSSSTNCLHHVQILIDTFAAYLQTDKIHVFAYASVDFILCIFHLIRGVSTYPSDPSTNAGNNIEETFIVFLKYVQKFCKILRAIHSVPEDSFVIAPYVRAKKAKRIEVDRLVEVLKKVNPSFKSHLPECLLIPGGEEQQTALLQLWSLVFDEYATTIYVSHLQFRPMLLEVYFTLLQTASELNGSLHILNHTLPLMQNILSETLVTGEEARFGIDELYMFLKSWLEVFNTHITKFLLVHFDQLSKNSDHENSDGPKWDSLGLLFRQSILIYIECLNGQYHDLISILALSLLRQLLLSLNRMLTTYFWSILIDCFQIGHQVTLAPLIQLLAAFTGLSVNSDLSRIKVMTTRTDRSSEHTRKRARQIFFVEQATVDKSPFNGPTFKAQLVDGMDNRDFNIIIETASGVNQSLSYNLLISQLHNHLVLLQVLSSVLTFNLKPSISHLMSFSAEEHFDEMLTADQSLTSLRPVLQLTLNQYRDVCSALKQSFSLAMEFDSRPGLKFLMQHICQTSNSANLYQMSALAWSVQFVVNFALSSGSGEHRNEECLASLEELFAEIGPMYSEKVKSLGSNRSPVKRDNGSPVTAQLPPILNLPFIEHQLDSESVDSVPATPRVPTAKCNPFDEGGQLPAYQLVSSHSFSQYLSDYRKTKQKQSTAHWHHRGSEPQLSLKANASAAFAATIDLGLDPETQRFLQQDSLICVRLWSNLLANAIDLHLASGRDTFCYLLPPFRLLVRQLMMHSMNEELRQKLQLSLSNWVDTLASQLIQDQPESAH